jgi:hypothetical protein
MHNLDAIIRYQLRDWLAHGLTLFYVCTAGVGPAVLGYCLGRRASVFVRFIPLLVILPAGVWWVKYSDHWIELYMLGNLIYVFSCVRGLKRRAQKDQIEFWALPHFDWLIVIVATIIMAVLYDPPAA